MNGTGTRKDSVSSDGSSMHGSAWQTQPPANAMLDGYNGTMTEGAPKDEERSKEPYGRGSRMFDPNDSVSMHLLTETAIGDSQQYEVCSVEEVDQLKKELPMLSKRIDATQRKLAIENKLRDGVTSLNRLNGPSEVEREGIGSRGGEETDEDLVVAQQNCADLTEELWQLEKRQQQVQRQLLEHTAGILQMTHKGFLEKDAPLQDNGVNGYTNGYSGLDINHLDDRFFYKALDSMLDEAQPETLASKEQTEAIVETERKLWDLSRRLRDTITQATSGRLKIPEPPGPEFSDVRDPRSALHSQITYLEDGIEEVQGILAQAFQQVNQSTHAMEERLEDINTQLRGVILRSSQDHTPQHPLPPEVTGNSAEGQVAYLEDGLDALEKGVSKLKEEHQNLSTNSTTYEERAEQYDSTLQNLWQEISEGERFSLDAFSSRILSLNTRINDLNYQKDILNRQIQQQRELNSKSDSEKDAKLASVATELKQSQDEVEKARIEVQSFEGEIVRLQTEVTVAKAELDGAYGTRAQRAAEVAQHPALQQEISALKQELEASKAKKIDTTELQERVQMLQQELSETIAEYESMTKSSIEFEKERETLENNVDALRDRCEALETQLNEEKVNKLGIPSPGTPGDRGSIEKGATSTSVLRSEFKKMMRETRAENMRSLRHEQEERRKLEAQLRDLKRGQTPGKSSLSQSMTAS
ncbi:MAG: hypothetical protein Q9163_003310 [Psora crenata]